jgi:iron complex outermembrane receptor protein
MRMRLLLAAAVGAALALSSVPSGAQSGGEPARPGEDAREQSRAAFRRGVGQAESGDYASARDSFTEAYRLFPHPSILLNLAIARAHTGQWLEAEQDLVHFLADDGGARPEELASARAELAQTTCAPRAGRTRCA